MPKAAYARKGTASYLKLQEKKQKNSKKPLRQAQGKLTMTELLAQVGEPQTLRRSQQVSGKIISVSPDEVLVDIGAKSEGVIMGRELAWAKEAGVEFKVGETLSATVGLPESEAGSVLLTLRNVPLQTRWQLLKKKKDQGEFVEVRAVEVQRAGLVVEIGGLRGFIPAAFLALEYLSDISLLIGKNFLAEIVELDESQNRIILSQKPTERKEELLKKLEKVEIGKQYLAKVRNVLPFGLLTEIEGVQGLIPLSELSWEKIDEPQKFFKQGDEVEVLVTDKDEREGRLTLSLKQLQEDPWQKVAEKYAKDQEVHGKVSKIERFGAFVAIEPGVEALLHSSKIPPGVELKAGQTVLCVVDSLDLKNRKISLSLVPTEKPVGYR